jgi:hypothetical protein
MKRLLLFAPLALTSLDAQTPASRALDRGSFLVTINGQRVWREDFTISGTPGARTMEYLSSATISSGSQKRLPTLWTDSAGTPSRYSHSVETRSTSGTTTESWMGTIVRGRVSARITNTRGPSEREYVWSEGAVILEDDVFHQYYFVMQRATGGSVRVVVPLRNRQLQLSVSSGGDESLTIGAKPIAARKFTLAEPNGDAREVWVDQAGHVLKVAIPVRGLVALRDEPPPA